MYTIFKSKARKHEGLLGGLTKRFIEKKLIRYAAEHRHTMPQMAMFSQDFQAWQIALFGRFERDELDDLFEFLKPVRDRIEQGVALDIGANIGNHTAFFSNKFANVYAFEPSPDIFTLLRFNTRNFANVKLFNFGLGSHKRSAQLVGFDENLTESRVAPMGNETKGVNVELETLDALLTDDPAAVTFIKIDIEGHELEALRGARDVLTKFQPLIVFEQNKTEFHDGSSPVIDHLRGLGYEICWAEYARERLKGSVRRELVKAYDKIMRRRPQIVTGLPVTEKFHSMMIAVPPQFSEDLLSKA